MFRHATLVILTLSATMFGCRTPVRIPPVAGIPTHLLESQAGLKAMNEATPDGYQRAVAHFKRAVDLRPATCDYKLQFAHASLLFALEQELNREDFNPARNQAIEAATCAIPDSPAALRLDAFSSLDNFAPGRVRGALTQIGKAIELEPQHPFNWFVRWKLNPATNRQENALLKAIELAPDLPLLQYELGNYLLLIGEYAEAQEAFERTIDLSPRHFRSYIGLAQAISALDEEADVENLYRTAVELGPDFLEGRVLLGDYFSGIEENEAAREQYTAVIERNSKFEVAHLRTGLSWLQSGNFDEAEKPFATAIQINPNSYEAYYYTGNIWFSRGDLDKARAQYEEALKFVLNFPEALYALGTVHFRQGRLDEALQNFEKVLRTSRNHGDAYFSRGNIFARRRQLFDAIEDYNRALGIYDSQLGVLQESIEEYEARGLLRKADAERRRKERLEANIERARESKARVEREIVGGQ